MLGGGAFGVGARDRYPKRKPSLAKARISKLGLAAPSCLRGDPNATTVIDHEQIPRELVARLLRALA